MVVRMRATKSHRNNRRSHHALKAVRLSVCSNCGKEHLRHRACRHCGFYRGRNVQGTVATPAPVAKAAPTKKRTSVRKTAVAAK